MDKKHKNSGILRCKFPIFFTPIINRLTPENTGDIFNLNVFIKTEEERCDMDAKQLKASRVQLFRDAANFKKTEQIGRAHV